MDGKRWGELRVFPSDDAQTPSRWRVSNADADGFDEVGADSAFYWNFNFKFTSMASTRRDATVTPSTWPSERLRLVNVQTAQVGDTPPVREAAQDLHRMVLGWFP